MQMGSMPVAVLMQRRALQHRWVSEAWSVLAVVSNPAGVVREQTIRDTPESQVYLVPGLELTLYPDENDGYFENWIAPSPKVFVTWHLQAGRAMPVAVSVSYSEGTRMLDSGDCSDGVAMPADIHEWLGAYLQAHYQPREPRKRGPRQP
ncbi:MAG: hypothetical protein NVSMB6_10270 [Burkholderiaceae bacterium]